MARIYLFLYIIVCVVKDSVPMISTKVMEGYASGYLGDCPGIEKPAIITRKSLKHLNIVVQGPGSAVVASRRRYNYFQLKNLAKDENFDFEKRTLLFVSGYLDSPNYVVSLAKIIGETYTELGYNALLLDTNRFTTFTYPVACRFVRPVGMHVAEMLANLTTLGLDPKKLEIVGLSLGGQTISFIAKNYQRITGIKISRLTGLDPAGPCFRNLGPDDRLDQEDADFVDVISTNIDGFGMAAPVGHVNFYVNGGEFQPGDVLVQPCNTLCSHIRSFTLWQSALANPYKFIAIKCDSVQQARRDQCYDREPLETNVVGLNSDRKTQGIFYLATTNNFPYYLGKNGTKREFQFWSRFVNSLNEAEIMKV